MKRLEIIFLLLIVVSSSIAATYTGTKPKDLDITTPTESNTKVSEFNNSDREIKIVITNLENLTTVTGTYTVAGTQTGILGSSTSHFTISFPTASTLATGSITKRFMIKNINTGTITLNLTVDGVGSPTVTGSQTFKVFTDGTSWFEERVNTAANTSNAGLLDNLDSTYFTDATNIATGTISLARIPGTLTGKDADTVDGYHAGTSASRVLVLDSSALTPLANIPTTLTGKDADTIDGINGSSIVKTTDDYVSRLHVVGSGLSITGNTGSVSVSNTGVKGLIAGTGISIDQATGSVTVTNSGVTQVLAGTGISLSGNTGAVTITASGTSSAGGWTEGATQTVSTLGLRVVPQGTLAVHADYGMVGVLDRDIPDDLTTTYNKAIGSSTIKPIQIAIGTETLQGALNAVGSATFSGTVTAVGFSGTHTGSGAGLTNISVSVAFSNVTGSATSAQLPAEPTFTGSSTFEGRLICGDNIYAFGTLSTSIGTDTTPAMTGYTTPSGIVTVDPNDGNGAAWQAFDDIVSTYWLTSDPGFATGTIRYDWGTGTTKKVRQYALEGNAYANMARDWTFDGSNDYSAWTTLDTVTGNTSATRTVHTLTNNNFYRWYRFAITANNGNAYLRIHEIELFAENNDILIIDNNASSGSMFMLIGTPTVFSTTTTSYVLQTGIGKNILSGGFNTFCFEASKEIIGSGSALQDKYYDYLNTLEIVESHPKVKGISEEDAENFALIDYVNSGYSLWEQNNRDRYIIPNEGTGTINYNQMITDYKTQRLLEWASELNQQNLISDKKGALESDRSILKVSPVSDRITTPDELRGVDKRTIDPLSTASFAIAITQKQKKLLEGQATEIQSLKAIIGSLTSRLNKAGL